jgi:hypothetical protein
MTGIEPSQRACRRQLFNEALGMLQTEFETLINDETKRIVEDISWAEDEDHSPVLEFRVEVESDPGWPLFVRGSYNPRANTLTYALVHRGSGRIYALDLGKDHHNPSCENVGEKHKHRWTELFRDKEAYNPADITAAASQPGKVWSEFCAEAKIVHQGFFREPIIQGELMDLIP